MAGLTAGNATRLAGRLTVGTTPKWNSSTGVTAACAPRVAAAASAAGPGRNRRSRTSRPDSNTIPTVAATDSWNPTA
jgi:hypothetical protein